MCIFCRIIEGSAPSHKVYEDEHTLAFLDIRPISDGHTLIVTKAHVDMLEDLDTIHSEALFRTLHRILGPIQRAMDAPAASIGINNGREAGQLVPHIHIHVIPRATASKRVFSDAVSRIKPRGPEYFQDVAERIRKEIKAR